jgi:leucyl aminopeptidase (aminopeptidase T)
MTLNCRPILLTLLLLAAIGTALGADAESDRAVHYPLTMARMQAFYGAYLKLIQAAVRDPKLDDALETDADEPAAKTIARLEAQPEIKKALAEAGLTPRQYVYTNLAYMGAAFGAAYQQTTHGKLDKAYDAANVDFYKAHKAALDAMAAKAQQQAQALFGGG